MFIHGQASEQFNQVSINSVFFKLMYLLEVFFIQQLNRYEFCRQNSVFDSFRLLFNQKSVNDKKCFVKYCVHKTMQENIYISANCKIVLFTNVLFFTQNFSNCYLSKKNTICNPDNPIQWIETTFVSIKFIRNNYGILK